MSVLKETGKESYLSGACVYLSGPIQFASDFGVGWRTEFKQKVQEANISLDILDPCNKRQKYFNEIGKWREELGQLKCVGSFDEVARRMKRVRRFDLRSVDLSDFVIGYVDPKIATWGTIDELVLAERQQKPVFIILNCEKEQAPDWLFTIARHNEMFTSVLQCINYLIALDTGSVVLDDRWVLIRSIPNGTIEERV